MVIDKLVMRDYYKFIVKIDDVIVGYKLNQIAEDKVELFLVKKPLIGSIIRLSLINEVYESTKAVKFLYVIGLLVSCLSAPEEGLLGNPITHICEFEYVGEIELVYIDGIFIDRNSSNLKSWLECDERNYKSWLFIMRCLTNLLCLIISILIFMVTYRFDIFPVYILIFFFLNTILAIYSKHILKQVK